MTFDPLEQIARTILYEGYLLYPYRASSLKNQQRFNFGVLVPLDCERARAAGDPYELQTEVLVQGRAARFHASCRFLQLMERHEEQVGTLDSGSDSTVDRKQRGIPVQAWEVDGQGQPTWREAVERRIESPVVTVSELMSAPCVIPFEFGPSRSVTAIERTGDTGAGRLVRTQQRISGTMSITAEELDESLFRVRLTLLNQTQFAGLSQMSREPALLYSLVSAHVVCKLDRGTFVSLLEPPESLTEAAAACQQVGCWPVLVGEAGDRSTILASPIILYDYPQIAAESPGDFFDATEMDEMLMLRVMTMTPEEQQEMRAVDERARHLLERTQSATEQERLRLHGTIRDCRPSESFDSATNETAVG